MDQEDSVERARADIEMLMAAYPDELEVEESTRRRILLSTTSDEVFPLHVTLRLSPLAWVKLEFNQGYPVETNIQIHSYRSGTDEKARLETSLSSIRKAAQQCLEEGCEGAFVCVSSALEAWGETDDRVTEHPSKPLPLSADNDRCYVLTQENERDSSDASSTYTWITGEPLHDRKSTFVAHVCRLYREADVRPALQQLLSGNNKLQKATHNMWAYRILESSANAMKPDTTSGTLLPATILKHDNDDDGEDAAGSRLGHLLELRRETSVLVVVSRWFGGISLGPKRFAHINNVARELLVHCHETVWKEGN